jgi:sulfotransferase family protein
MLMNKLFTPFRKTETKPIVIVSGLPRSGTSMMMKMLAEGGLPILTDEVRGADDDNPNGYFELETVRKLKEGNFEWLKEADGKVVKVISALLENLPQQYSYKIIFMERALKEVLASQKKMLDHRGTISKVSDEEMEQQLHKHLLAIRPWLVRQPNIDVLYVNYNALISKPELLCERIEEFLESPLDQKKMLSVPTEKLYRNRAVVEK